MNRSLRLCRLLPITYSPPPPLTDAFANVTALLSKTFPNCTTRPGPPPSEDVASRPPPRCVGNVPVGSSTLFDRNALLVRVSAAQQSATPPPPPLAWLPPPSSDLHTLPLHPPI